MACAYHWNDWVAAQWIPLAPEKKEAHLAMLKEWAMEMKDAMDPDGDDMEDEVEGDADGDMDEDANNADDETM